MSFMAEQWTVGNIPLVWVWFIYACSLNLWHFVKNHILKEFLTKRLPNPDQKWDCSLFFNIDLCQICCTCLFFGTKQPTFHFQRPIFTHQGARGGYHGYTLKSGRSSIANTMLSFLLLIWNIWSPRRHTMSGAHPICSEGVKLHCQPS